MVSKKFAALIKKGNVNAAINLLSEKMKNGVLPLNNETLNRLKLKHPKPKKADKNVNRYFKKYMMSDLNQSGRMDGC